MYRTRSRRPYLSVADSRGTGNAGRWGLLRVLVVILVVGLGGLLSRAQAQSPRTEASPPAPVLEDEFRPTHQGTPPSPRGLGKAPGPEVPGHTTGDDSVSVEWERVRYEGRPHIKVTTSRAVYFYDDSGGGFSRIIDAEGHDWVGWHPQPTGYPPGAAGFFRGVPNYRDGPGHPGYDACSSRVDRAAPDRVVIRSTCREGAWAFTWTFYPRYAKNHVESTPEKIWFLYEGPIAGRYAPREQYWGTDRGGPYTTAPNWVAGEREHGDWQWAYFGDSRVDRVLFLAMEGRYTDKSIFGYLGAVDSADTPDRALDAAEGMIVFGFGRKAYPDKHIAGDDKTFYLGFVEHRVVDSTSHDEVAHYVEELIGENRN